LGATAEEIPLETAWQAGSVDLAQLLTRALE
jgi:hypothetical protein